jgi:hypothetical protein
MNLCYRLYLSRIERKMLIPATEQRGSPTREIGCGKLPAGPGALTETAGRRDGKRWLGKSGHRGKWIVGLNAASMAAVQEA